MRIRSASPSQPSVSVVARKASLSGSSSGARRPARRRSRLGDAAPLELVEELAEPLREHRDLGLLEDDADDPAAVAGLEEERPVAGLADGAGDEAVGQVEDEEATWHASTVPTGPTRRRGCRSSGPSGDVDADRVVAAGAVGRGRRAIGRLDLAGAVGRPDLDACGRPGGASQSYSHWTQVAFEIGRRQRRVAPRRRRSRPRPARCPRSGAHATPAIGDPPGLDRLRRCAARRSATG